MHLIKSLLYSTDRLLSQKFSLFGLKKLTLRLYNVFAFYILYNFRKKLKAQCDKFGHAGKQ